MTNKGGETGDPGVVPTHTGANTLGDPCYRSRQDLPDREDLVQDTRYGLRPLALSMPQRVVRLTLSKPPFMSRNREETFLPAIWRGFTSWVWVVTESEAERPASEPYWWGLRRPVALTMQESLEFIILSRIFEKVWSRNMTRKDEGESYEGFPGLTSTMPLALLRVRGWDP